METAFIINLQNRKTLYNILKSNELNDLLKIPKGFKNNIFWNIAHSITIQQRLVYTLSGQKIHIPADFIEKYGNGTIPQGKPSPEELQQIEQLLFTTVEKTKEDYQNKVFRTFSPYTTALKVTLNTVEDAILFNNYHEGLHLGYSLALKKAISA
jgi:DinB superfamily